MVLIKRLGSEISVYYDSMIAKVIVHAPTRAEAVRRMAAVLARTVILGVTTNQKFLLSIMNNPRFQSGTFDTNFITLEKERLFPKRSIAQVQSSAIAALLLEWRVNLDQRVNLRNIQPSWRNIKWKVPTKKYIVDGQEEIQVAYEYQDNQQFICGVTEAGGASAEKTELPLKVTLYDAHFGERTPTAKGIQGCSGLLRCSIGQFILYMQADELQKKTDFGQPFRWQPALLLRSGACAGHQREDLLRA